MEWYYILLIALGSLILVAALVFVILYLTSKSAKNKSLGKAKGLYSKIVDAFGGISNVDDISVNGSRLTLVLKDNSFINNETLKLMNDEGFGIFKTSKKITLVIGEMAEHYYKAIVKEMNK